MLATTTNFALGGNMKINPDAAGLDGAQLERIEAHLRRSYIEPRKIAGCQTVVARRGQVAYFGSLGSMDLERDKPVREDTIWRIYSMSKPITGVALMKLYERGLFQLNDPVHRFIPAWRDLKVEERAEDGSKRLVDPARPMTVRDVMMHMSGLGYGGKTPLPPMGRAGTSLEEYMQQIAEAPLHFHPGSRWLYGVSTDVCGRLVEILSGQPFDEFLRAELFEPLGMVDTGFVVPDDKLDRFAANYGRGPEKELRLVDDPETSIYRAKPAFLSGGGGLVSTSADYLRFIQMLCNGGELDGARILGRKTVELMSLNHLPGNGELRDVAIPGAYGETGFDGVGFGLTMAVSLGAVASQTIGSTGDYYWGGAASTIFWIDPVEELVVLFMTQFMPSGTFNFRGQLKTLVSPAIVD
jgi:CubicO group peptidase (beta-lactamase class C family)